MNLRQAAQQALEALEALKWKGSPSFVKHAITALRAALDEPQTTHWEGCEAVHPECKATPRKPLTPEQLTKIELGLRVYADNDRYDLSLHDFARAIERAHSIGEQHGS